jgi:hypothetical protein
MKVIVNSDIGVNYGDDKGNQHTPQDSIIDVPKATAENLVSLGRALFVDKADDQTKGRLTADRDYLKAAASRLAAAEAKSTEK